MTVDGAHESVTEHPDARERGEVDCDSEHLASSSESSLSALSEPATSVCTSRSLLSAHSSSTRLFRMAVCVRSISSAVDNLVTTALPFLGRSFGLSSRSKTRSSRNRACQAHKHTALWLHGRPLSGRRALPRSLVRATAASARAALQ